MTTAEISRVLWTICIFIVIVPSSTGVFAANGSATYLLITNEELAPAFQALVDRRTSQGFPGKLVTVESISSHYSGVDTPEQIRNCVRDHYLNHGTLYVALGGDDMIVPVRYCDPKSSSFEMPADLYYSDMDGGDWDANHNGIYGQLGDVDEIELTPDVHLGRIPVRTVENAIAYIDKVVIYETATPDGFANSMILFGAWGFYSGDARRRDFLHHDPVSGAEFHQMYRYYRFIQPYWQAMPLHVFWDAYSSWDTEVCGDYVLTLDRLSEKLNEGYHFLFYWGHGAPGAWGMARGRRFTSGHAAALTNPIPSIVISFSCSVAGFDIGGVCLSEAFLQNPDGGAVVYFGHTRAAGGGDKDCQQLFLAMFREGAKTVGEAMTQVMTAQAQGHVSDPYEQYNFTLQGDPCIQLLGEESGRHLQVFQPKGCEIIERGTDFYIRWNAAGADFMPDEKVKLEYSADSGRTWHAIRRAEALRYNKEVFIWDKCLLPVGSNYRVRVTSLTDRRVSDSSLRDFTIGELVFLTVQSNPVKNIIVDVYGDVADCNIITDFNISNLKGATVILTAPLIPEDMSEWEFTRWSDEAGNTLSDTQDCTFTFTNDMTIVAEYSEPIKQQYYVNDELPENGIAAGDDNNDGDKPLQPMRHIQALLAKYPNLKERCVINVSAGTYEENISLDDKNAGFELLGAGQDVTIIDGKQNGSCISLNGCSNVVISGFTIQNGSASRGGGIYCSGSSPKIKECTFVENAAEGKGGAIFTDGSSSPEILDCIFMRNSGKSGGAVCNWGRGAEIKSCLFEANQASRYGGAIHIWAGRGVSQVLDCIFVENTARQYGGAIFLDRSTVPQVSDCIFRDNSARDGGALCNYGGTAEIKSCLFEANHAVGYGGAVDNRHGCSPSFSKCIFYTNEGRSGGAIATIGELDNANVTNCTFSRNNATENGGALYVGYNKCTTATNCILWGNTPGQIIGEASASYCNVQGGWRGEGNIDADPLFADPDNIDYHLKSQAGRWAPNRQSWIIDSVTSPCIDAGHPYTAIGDEQEPNGNRINMGAYGGTTEASKSP